MRFIFVLSLFSAFSFAYAESQTSGKPVERTLVLNWKAEPQFGGFYEAKYQGVKILEGGSGTPTLQMIQNGQADYGIISGEEILLSKDRSQKNSITAVFATYQNSPLVLIAHEERGFQSIEDFFKKDGVLAVQSGLSYFQFLQKKYGKPRAKVVPYPGGIQFFLMNPQYSQQGFLTSEPLLIEKAGKKAKSFLVSEAGFRPYNTVLVVRTDFLKKNREEVIRFVQLTREGWNRYLTDPTAANVVMGKINRSMDAETFRKSALRQKDLILTAETTKNGLGWMDSARWNELIETLKDLKILKKDFQSPDLFQNL